MSSTSMSMLTTTSSADDTGTGDDGGHLHGEAGSKGDQQEEQKSQLAQSAAIPLNASTVCCGFAAAAGHHKVKFPCLTGTAFGSNSNRKCLQTTAN
ncbi:hypothetical protein TYRP_006914 [Tyrophagus putrescentiae]|nr:hypothetical protein TYRP_006914 [Tyrophagus putrescentiae]